MYYQQNHQKRQVHYYSHQQQDWERPKHNWLTQVVQHLLLGHHILEPPLRFQSLYQKTIDLQHSHLLRFHLAERQLG